MTLYCHVAFSRRVRHPPCTCRCRSTSQRKRNDQSISIEELLDVWALFGPLRKIEIPWDRCGSSQVRVCLFLHIYLSQFPPHSLFLTIYLFGIDSPREPEDLFLFTRNPSFDTFEARYLVDAPTSVKIRCLLCDNVKPSEQNRLDINGMKTISVQVSNSLELKELLLVKDVIIWYVHRHKIIPDVAGIHYRWTNQCKVFVSWAPMYHTLHFPESDPIMFRNNFLATFPFFLSLYPCK